MRADQSLWLKVVDQTRELGGGEVGVDRAVEGVDLAHLAEGLHQVFIRAVHGIG